MDWLWRLISYFLAEVDCSSSYHFLVHLPDLHHSQVTIIFHLAKKL